MGLIKELTLLPVAPLRFTVWVSEKVAEQVDQEHHSPEAHMRKLREIDEARQRGELSEEAAAEAEAGIIEEARSPASSEPTQQPEGVGGG